MNAPGIRRLTFRHSWNRGGDGWGDTTGPTMYPTIHKRSRLTAKYTPNEFEKIKIDIFFSLQP
jgi:hypothetical protein